MIKNKKILIDIPTDLYERFIQSKFRKESKTNAEALRSCIKFAIENSEKPSPENKDTTPKGVDSQG